MGPYLKKEFFLHGGGGGGRSRNMFSAQKIYVHKLKKKNFIKTAKQNPEEEKGRKSKELRRQEGDGGIVLEILFIQEVQSCPFHSS